MPVAREIFKEKFTGLVGATPVASWVKILSIGGAGSCNFPAVRNFLADH